jgi:tetratricopeptide (TPR) repeat protein
VTPKLPALTAALAALLAVTACASTRPSRTSDDVSAAPGAAPRSAALQSPAAKPGGEAPARRELSPRAQRLFDEAVAAAEEQKRLKVPTDWETLERRWRAVTEAEPVPEAFFNLGVTLEQRRRLDDARAAYRRALALEPRFAPAAVNLALLDEPTDPRLALQAWSDVLRRFPDDPVPRVRLAALYERAGQHDEAWRLAREALIHDPRSLGAYKVMMRIALDRNRYDLAQLLAVKAGKLDAADPEVVSFLGDVYARQNDGAAAVEQWKKAVALRDDYLPARHALLASALGKQHWEGVVEQAKNILQTTPSDARVHLVLGIAYRHLGQPDKALASYEQAEKLGEGKLPEVHLARGAVLMKSKEQCEPALAELKRYIAAAGPAVASDGPAPRMQRDCEQLLAMNRQAQEAAREMKAQAEREAEAASKKPATGTPAAPGPAVPAGSASGRPDRATPSPRSPTSGAAASNTDIRREGPTR